MENTEARPADCGLRPFPHVPRVHQIVVQCALTSTLVRWKTHVCGTCAMQCGLLEELRTLMLHQGSGNYQRRGGPVVRHRSPTTPTRGAFPTVVARCRGFVCLEKRRSQIQVLLSAVHFAASAIADRSSSLLFQGWRREGPCSLHCYGPVELKEVNRIGRMPKSDSVVPIQYVQSLQTPRL